LSQGIEEVLFGHGGSIVEKRSEFSVQGSERAKKERSRVGV
jgi:hypothetical protein